jgi:hypothetical protein
MDGFISVGCACAVHSSNSLLLLSVISHEKQRHQLSMGLTTLKAKITSSPQARKQPRLITPDKGNEKRLNQDAVDATLDCE